MLQNLKIYKLIVTLKMVISHFFSLSRQQGYATIFGYERKMPICLSKVFHRKLMTSQFLLMTS